MSTDRSTPAFPRTIQRWNDSLDHAEGMTLRDWFAGQALAEAIRLHDAGNYDGGNAAIAACAYQIADAMLVARGGPR